MKKSILLGCIATCCTAHATAQWWEDAELPGLADGVTEIYEDSVTNTMYCTGALQFGMGSPNTFRMYHQGSWSVSDSFNLDVMTVRRYNDTLVVGGAFSEVNGQAFQHIAAYVNGTWVPYGAFNGLVYALRVLGGNLYAVGFFTVADGHSGCGGVAKRVGGNWEPVGNMPAIHDYPGWTDIILYQGNLVVTGTTTFEGLPFKHIIQYDGQQWVPLGPGIQTSLGGGGTLAVYKNELYVGGIFRLSEGNVGHCIMRWNGSEWHPVGTGVQDEDNGYSYAIGVRKLIVKDSLLFACGGFHYAGNAPAAFTATWDGDRWCGFSGSMDPFLGAVTMGFYGDTLFVGCGNMADGQPVNHLVRYIGETWGDSCSVPMGDFGMGITDAPTPQQELRLADLGDGRYRLLGVAATGELRVYDAMGRLLRVLGLHAEADGTDPFDLSGLPTGGYLLDLAGQWRGHVTVVHW